MLYYLAQEREKKMDKLKKYASYFVLLIVFFIFSNFLIYVGLNSNYRDINRQDNIGEVYVYQAQATKVNGRIRGLACIICYFFETDNALTS